MDVLWFMDAWVCYLLKTSPPPKKKNKKYDHVEKQLKYVLAFLQFLK